jgi:hypothetical protein
VAESALDNCRGMGVGVQLAAQQAKAWARIGDREAMERALERGRNILRQLDNPANLDNHFVVDAQKFDFYAMDCCRVAGDNRPAEAYARQVIRSATGLDGSVRQPMRVSEAQLTLAVVAVRDRDLELAVDEAMRAFEGKRRSLPSLLWIAGEAAREMIERYPSDPRTRTYLEQLRVLSMS